MVMLSWTRVILTAVVLFTNITHVHLQSFLDIDEPFQLKRYKNAGDIYFIKFQVPENMDVAVFSFTLLSKLPDCPVENATVYVRRGGLPVVDPLGESFPSGFIGRGDYTSVVNLSTISGHEQNADFWYYRPSPGMWFSAAFLTPTSQVSKIHPTGLGGNECHYFLRAKSRYIPQKSSEVLMLPTFSRQSVVLDTDASFYRFYIPRNVYTYNITVDSCKVLTSPSNKTNCIFTMMSSGSMGEKSCNLSGFSSSTGSSNNTTCSMMVEDVTANSWSLLKMSREDGHVHELTVTVTYKGCETTIDECQVDELYPITIPSGPYTANFYSLSSREEYIILRDDKPYITSFSIEGLVHSGGTIAYKLSPLTVPKNVHTNVYICISHQSFTISSDRIKNCSNDDRSTSVWTADNKNIGYIPYPAEGTYYISILAECRNKSDLTKIVSCTDTIKGALNVTLAPCVSNSCGKYGKCYLYYNGIIHWSVCKCKAGYRGFGCTDSTNALTDGMQLVETLFLTLSNLLFLGAVIFAIYRKWFSEALIYLFVFISSSLYHACDNGTIYAICVIDYSILQYCDFFGSIFAVWVTSMAMAEIPQKLRSFLHTAGCLGILIGTQFSLTGVWNFVVPVLMAAVILSSSWARICFLNKKCYPEMKIWLRQCLPGTTCALIGLILYCAVETDANYYYIHSIWHLLMALAIIFLLPKREPLRYKNVVEFFRSLRSVHRRNSVRDSIENSENNTVLIGHQTLDGNSDSSSDNTANQAIKV